MTVHRILNLVGHVILTKTELFLSSITNLFKLIVTLALSPAIFPISFWDVFFNFRSKLRAKRSTSQLSHFQMDEAVHIVPMLFTGSS